MSIDIKLISENQQLIELGHLILSEFNPRYETVKKLDGKYLANLITKNDGWPEQDIADQLFSWEGDLKDFLSLVNSIKDNGFRQEDEKIVLVKTGDKKYVVAEGNRRVWALKLISGCLKWQWPQLKNKNTSWDNSNEDFQDDSDDNYRPEQKQLSKTKDNFARIENILTECKHKAFKTKVMVLTQNLSKINEDKTKAEEFFRMIYSRNLEGIQKRGKRPWGRGKWFVDLLTQNEDKLELEYISTLTNVEIDKVKRDYRYALFVRDIVVTGLRNESSNQAKISPDDVMDKIKKIKVSPLQYNFSVRAIKTAAREELGVSEERFADSYFSFKTNMKNNKIVWTIKSSLISEAEIKKFIWKWCERKIITTRTINPHDKKAFNYAVVKLLEAKEIDPEKINEGDFKDINILERDDEELKTLSHRFPNYKNLKSWLDVRAQLHKIESKDWKKSELTGTRFAVFARLCQQMKHNLRSDFPRLLYFNAIACSIRSFYEQLLTWHWISAEGYYSRSEIRRKRKKKYLEFNYLYRYAKNWFYNTQRNDNKRGALKYEIPVKYLNEWLGIYRKNDIIRRNSDNSYERSMDELIHASFHFFVLKPNKEPYKNLNIVTKLVRSINELLDIAEKDKDLAKSMNNFSWDTA